MENVLAIALFDLALVAPPLAVVIGIVMLVMPAARPKVIASTQTTAHAA